MKQPVAAQLLVAASFLLASPAAFAEAVNVCNRYNFDIRAGFSESNSASNNPETHHISWFTVRANTCTTLTGTGISGPRFVGRTYDNQYRWGEAVPLDANYSPSNTYTRPYGDNEYTRPICVFKNPYVEWTALRPVVAHSVGTRYACPANGPNSPYELRDGFHSTLPNGVGTPFLFTFDNSKLTGFPKQTAIIYVNGASGEEFRAAAQLVVLEASFRAYLGAQEHGLPDTLSFQSLFVSGSGNGAVDLVEALFQARCTDYGMCKDGDPIQPSIWAYYKARDVWGAKTNQVIGEHFAANSYWLRNKHFNALTDKIKQSVAAGYRVVVVAHSQGTELANAVMGNLLNEGEGGPKDFASTLLVGSITNSVFKGNWVTLTDDKVVNAARVINPYTLPGNVTNENKGEATNHALVGSYLQGDVSGPRIQALIYEQLQQTPYPSYPTQNSGPPSYQVADHPVNTALVEDLAEQAVGTAMACYESSTQCAIAIPPLPTDAVEELVTETYAVAHACRVSSSECPVQLTTGPLPPSGYVEAVQRLIDTAVETAVAQCREISHSTSALCTRIGVADPQLGLLEGLVNHIYAVAQTCLQGACPKLTPE